MENDYIITNVIARGYVLIKSDNPNNSVKEILGLNYGKNYGVTKNYLIRADQIKDGLDINIVAPVHANSDDHLREIEEDISRCMGVSKTTLAIVKTYLPEKPHTAQGFVTEDEHNPIEPGPQDRNVWG